LESPRRPGSLRILFVAPYVPSPLRTRPFHLIKALAERGHSVDLIAAATSAGEQADATALGAICRRTRVVRIPTARSLWSCTRGLLGDAPLQARYCFAPAMSAAVHDAMTPRSGGYDVLHVEHLRAALYGLQARGVPRIYDAVDCMSRLLAQAAGDAPTGSTRLAARAELGRTRAFERRLLGAFDRVLVTAATERDALQALSAPARAAATVTVLGNGVDIEYFAPTATQRDPATVVFIGRMGYHANIAAARELLTAIMPRVWARRPEARLRLVGPDPPQSLRSLAAGAAGPVEITGYVPDIRPALARATVSVSPLRYAVGVQNKVLEAMAMATPVVATPAACAALGAIHGEQLLVETDAASIAAAVMRLFDDPVLAQRLAGAGRRYVTAAHDWRHVAAKLELVYRETIDQVAAHTASGAHPS